MATALSRSALPRGSVLVLALVLCGGCADDPSTAPGLVAAVSGAAIVGEVITAGDQLTGSVVEMSAIDGSGRRPVPCPGSVTHGGPPRFRLRVEPTGTTNLDGSPHHALVSYSEDCSLRLLIYDDPAKKVANAAWSIDGLRVGFSAVTFATPDDTVDLGIYVGDVGFSAGVPSTLDNVRLAIDTDAIGAFSWSGDNQRVAYSARVGGQYDVFVGNVETGTVTNVTNSPSNEQTPAFAPAGDMIAFSMYTVVKGQTRADIFTMPASGGPATRITGRGVTSTMWNILPDWSPDALEIAYSGAGSSPQATWDIFRIRADGSKKPINLTPDGEGSFISPFWRR